MKYGETVWSDLFPGNRHTTHCLVPAVEATEIALDLDRAKCEKTVWRADGGAGSDQHIGWLLDRGYHILVKGHSNRRANRLAADVTRWDSFGDAYVGEVEPPINYGRPVRFFVKKWAKNDRTHYSYYVTTLKLPSKQCFIQAYDDRGGAEVEQFREDKSGLSLAKRRKHRFYAQLGIILMVDLAHNLLAEFRRIALSETRFAEYGVKRIIRDLLKIDGKLTFDDSKLIKVDLSKSNTNSEIVKNCLEKYILSE